MEAVTETKKKRGLETQGEEGTGTGTKMAPAGENVTGEEEPGSRRSSNWWNQRKSPQRYQNKIGGKTHRIGRG
jgi:hypothetical protein